MVDVKRLRSLMAEATPLGELGRSCFYQEQDLVAMGITKQNAAFLIASAHAIPQLLSELDKLREALQEAARVLSHMANGGPLAYARLGAEDALCALEALRWNGKK